MANDVLALVCLVLTAILLAAGWISSLGTPYQSQVMTTLPSFQLAEQLKWYAAEMNLRTELGGVVDEEAMRVAVVRAAGGKDYTRQPELAEFRRKELPWKTQTLRQFYKKQIGPLV